MIPVAYSRASNDQISNFSSEKMRKHITIKPEMDDREFRILKDLIYRESGIHLTEKKRMMLSSRLYKRLMVLGLSTYSEYIDYLSTGTGKREEIYHLIDRVSTNKTEFFRDRAQFDYLKNTVLENYKKTIGTDTPKTLTVWSAGCSTGEEPYSIAMTIDSCFNASASHQYTVYASDINKQVLADAAKAVYDESAADSLPESYLKKYFMRGKGKMEGHIRVVPELRSRVVFSRVNIVEDHFNFQQKLDIVFCRNVVIYFNKETQKKLFKKFYDSIRHGGYLFIGSSETLNWISESFIKRAPSIYQKPF